MQAHYTRLNRVRAAAKISAGGVGSSYNQLNTVSYSTCELPYLWVTLPLVLTTVVKISSVSEDI